MDTHRASSHGSPLGTLPIREQHFNFAMNLLTKSLGYQKSVL